MSLTGIIQSKVEKRIADYFDGQWSLIDMNSGQNIVTFTSFIDADISDENKVVEEAVEEGSFASYNKVETPIVISVTLGLSGTTAILQNALNALKKYCHSTDLISLVTPTAEYQNLNLEKYDYQLKREIGRGALYVALSLIEIRQVKSEYTNVKVAPQQDRGKVQGKEVGSGSGNVQKAPNRSMLASATNALSK